MPEIKTAKMYVAGGDRKVTVGYGASGWIFTVPEGVSVVQPVIDPFIPECRLLYHEPGTGQILYLEADKE